MTSILKPSRKRRTKAQIRAQAGGQLGSLLLPLLKFAGPLIAGEALKFGITSALRKSRKRKRGKGLKTAGGGLRLAGQRGQGRKRKVGRPKKLVGGRRKQVVRRRQPRTLVLKL